MNGGQLDAGGPEETLDRAGVVGDRRLPCVRGAEVRAAGPVADAERAAAGDEWAAAGDEWAAVGGECRETGVELGERASSEGR
jgi:hypothetical protein